MALLAMCMPILAGKKPLTTRSKYTQVKYS
jgi:hypothetical protein